MKTECYFLKVFLSRLHVEILEAIHVDSEPTWRACLLHVLCCPLCRPPDPRSPHTTLRCSPGPVHIRGPPTPSPYSLFPLLDPRGAQGDQHYMPVSVSLQVILLKALSLTSPSPGLGLTLWVTPGRCRDRSFHKACGKASVQIKWDHRRQAAALLKGVLDWSPFHWGTPGSKTTGPGSRGHFSSFDLCALSTRWQGENPGFEQFPSALAFWVSIHAIQMYLRNFISLGLQYNLGTC